MTSFSTEAQLSFSDSSLKSASKQLERELGDVSIGVETGGTTARRMGTQSGGGVGSAAASTAVGTKLSGMSGSLEETLELDEERNTVLSELLEATERNNGSGGGGGGVSGLLTMGGVASMLSGGLTSLIPSVGLGSLITKASFKSLLTKAPALATLVTAASLTDDLINGTLGPDDLVDSAINVGELMTFDTLDSKLIEGAIGTVTLSYGAVQIGSLITGTLGSTALSGYLGSIGIGSILGSLPGATALSGMLGSAGIGAVLAPLAAGALATYLGSIGIEKLIDMHDDAEGYNQGTSKSSAGTDAAQQGGVDFDSLEGVDAPDVENPRGHIPASEAATAIREVDSNPNGVGEASSDGGGSGGGGDGDTGGSSPNQARENTSRPPQITHSPTYQLDTREIKRKQEQNRRDLQKQIDDLKQSFNP